MAARQAVEFVIKTRQPFQRAPLSVVPGAEKRAYIGFSRLTLSAELYRRARF